MRRRTLGLLVVASAAMAACGNGKSILDAGNDPLPVTTTVPVTGPVGSTVPGETVPTTQPPTTTTTPLADLPPCPVDALDGAGTVEITFWHGLNGENEAALTRLIEQYHASQDRVRVRLENQGGYDQTIDKYVQSGVDGRPELVMFPEYVLKQMADSDTVVPVGACVEASGFDVSALQPSTVAAYTTEGVQWAMPFNVSNPVLYYLKPAFVQAGLDPERPPRSLEELREYSQAIVDSGAAAYGIALDSGVDSGGGWFLEQWFANMGELYADNQNGRVAPATRVLYDGPAGVELLTFVQQLLNDGLAVSVGDNQSGQDNFLRLANQESPAAMTIGTSAALGTLKAVVDAGIIPGRTSDDVGIGPMPGPGPVPSALVGGASLYVVADQGDPQAAAAWDVISFLVSPQSQSTFAVETGYAPVRPDALELDPVKTTYAQDPRFRVAYDQLVQTADDPSKQGPVLGPQREVRAVTARAVADIFGGADVAAALAGAAQQSNALIADYAARN